MIGRESASTMSIGCKVTAAYKNNISRRNDCDDVPTGNREENIP